MCGEAMTARRMVGLLAVGVLCLFCLAVFVFMALAWPVWGFREPTIALLICIPVAGLILVADWGSGG